MGFMFLLNKFILFLKSARERFVGNISRGIINYNGVRELLKKHARMHNIYISDNFYYLTDKNTMVNILKAIPVKKLDYVPEKNDCDDFALDFMCVSRFLLSSYPVGIVWTSDHAFNFFIALNDDDNPEVYFWEPQLNRCLDHKVYKASLLLV